jgi:truncated hemoglobin YjbI
MAATPPKTVSAKPGKFANSALKGVHEAVGGIEVYRKISQIFHHSVESDPLLKGLFPENMQNLEERLALFLAEYTGGPADFSATRGKNSLVCRHAHLAIGNAEAERWLKLMDAAMQEAGVDAEARQKLFEELKRSAATLVDPFIPLYNMPIARLRQVLEADPSLVRANHHGRNLICNAAMAIDMPRMRLLLELGADVNMPGTGGHNPLYRVTNGTDARSEEDGTAAVELLLQYGADVNQVTGVGGMTPLHMSARRGTVRIAEVLLNAGASIDAPDKNGETPLRRAVNCGHLEFVKLLVCRGANPHLPDKKGISPLDAAKTEPMRRALLGEK